MFSKPLQLFAALLMVLTLSVTTQAQTSEPEPTLVIRTPEDIAAAQALDAALDIQAPQSIDPRNVPPGDTSHFEIPNKIKVGYTGHIHCGEWLDDGMPVLRVEEMDFKEYVKNVLPNEWIYTWHPESLKAGAVAAKTFAWWRMTLNNPRPNGADVVDNTCDQVFRPNSRRASTDLAVDETWHYRMSRDNLIKNIHYLDTDQRCADTTILRPCMGQWGTQNMALAGWQWDAILHFYYDPTDISITSTIAPYQNVLLNGKFTEGTDHWRTWGGIQGNGVVDGVYRFYRGAGSTNPATLLQDMNFKVPKGTPFRVKLKLGNSSSVEKIVNVHLHNTDNWKGALSCQFTLPPNVPLQKYELWGTAKKYWPALRLEISGDSADNQPDYLIDSVKVQYQPSKTSPTGENCRPPEPGKPVVVAPTSAAPVTTAPFTVTLEPGKSNLRPGYNAQYHVQVATDEAFTQLVYDNGAALATAPDIVVTLSNGDYFLRARQFDGIDRYSLWGNPIPFTVTVLPGAMTALSPQDGTLLPMDAPLLTWSAASHTDKYKLVVKKANGKAALKQTLTPTVCVENVCSLNPIAAGMKAKPGKTYTWVVKAINSVGQSKSAKWSFTIPESP